jgi:hypothetical protein
MGISIIVFKLTREKIIARNKVAQMHEIEIQDAARYAILVSYLLPLRNETTLTKPSDHERKIRDAAIAAERRLNEERELEAEARAEEARRQARVPHRPREDVGRRQDDHRHNIPEARRHEQRQGLRPEREHRYEDDYEYEYEDEGYRSRPASGANGMGW